MLNTLQHISLALTVPGELIPRERAFTYEIGILLFVAFVIIAFAQFSRPRIYASVAIAMLKTTSVRTYIRESLPLHVRGSILLLFNYGLSTSIILYLWLENSDLTHLDQIVISTVLPAVYFFYGLGSLGVTSLVTGEKRVLKESIIMKIIGAQFLGLVYFICGVLWVLNATNQELIVQVVLWSFIIEASLRIIKSITTVYVNGVSWYYIILYFCTLEILPLFVVYYYVMQNVGAI